MVKLAAKTSCTACSACYNVCPKHAVVMEKDEFGFWAPRIDTAKCVECGACERKCPVLHSTNAPRTETAYYAVAVKDLMLRDKGSSGGAFGYLADKVLGEGGVVFGAFFNDALELSHGSTDEVTLDRLKKSKYLESRIGLMLKQCKKELVSGRKVLFCGTPCQIEGLRSYLGKDYENLLMVDFLCHGVPSAMVFEQYLKYLEKRYGSKVAGVEFRSKALGWKTYCIRSTFENGKSSVVTKFKDPYLIEFFKNKVLRESCYSCTRNTRSSADLTLGDFWGVVNYKEIKDDDTGISLLRSNTSRGAREISRMLDDEAVSIKELPYSCVAYAFREKKYSSAGRNERLTSIRDKGFPLASGSSKASLLRDIVYSVRGKARGVRYKKKISGFKRQ